MDRRELEWQQKDSIIPTCRHYPGTFYAIYWAAAARATQADQSPSQWLALVAAALWMFTDVVVVVFYTAQLAATLTVQKVATAHGSAATAALKKLRAEVHDVA